MKKVFTLCIFAVAVLFNMVNAQNCTPDHTGYTTVPDSGILLPNPLPHATVGVPYTQTFTVGIPGTAQGYAVNWIKFNHMSNFITADTWNIVNSTGGTTFPNWSKLTWQCVTMTGTPTVGGVDSIVIYVDANVTVVLFPVTQTNQKAFTLPLVIDDLTSVKDIASESSQLIQSRPNPFHDFTQIGLTATKSESATLNIYSNLGQLVYNETKTMNQGENYFSFDGSTLATGNYIYTVVTDEKIFREKLIKVE